MDITLAAQTPTDRGTHFNIGAVDNGESSHRPVTPTQMNQGDFIMYRVLILHGVRSH
jgi:hypothetical protein